MTVTPPRETRPPRLPKAPATVRPPYDYMERLRRERAAQGLPPMVEDPEALRILVALCGPQRRRA